MQAPRAPESAGGGSRPWPMGAVEGGGTARAAPQKDPEAGTELKDEDEAVCGSDGCSEGGSRARLAPPPTALEAWLRPAVLPPSAVGTALGEPSGCRRARCAGGSSSDEALLELLLRPPPPPLLELLLLELLLELLLLPPPPPPLLLLLLPPPPLLDVRGRVSAPTARLLSPAWPEPCSSQSGDSDLLR